MSICMGATDADKVMSKCVKKMLSKRNDVNVGTCVCVFVCMSVSVSFSLFTHTLPGSQRLGHTF